MALDATVQPVIDSVYLLPQPFLKSLKVSSNLVSLYGGSVDLGSKLAEFTVQRVQLK